MNKEQTLEITLKEYLELKESHEHRHEVEIRDYSEISASGTSTTTGSSIGWKSQGKCWNILTNKIRDIGYREQVLIKRQKKVVTKLKKMKYSDFKKMQKEIKNKETVDALIYIESII